MKKQHNQRRLRYLDDNIQRWFLVALLFVEMLMVVAAMWILYGSLSGIIEEQIYQIHFGERTSIFKHLVNEGAKILGVFLLVNLLILVIADRIWAYRVHEVTKGLSELIKPSLQLDFARKNQIHCTHPVMMHAVAWRHAEHDRIAVLRKSIHSLPDQLPQDAQQLDAAKTELKRISDVLPML